jgi:hypothetical protein
MALFSIEAHTLNLAELFTAPFLLCLNTKEPHIFEVIGHASIEFFVILICHCAEGASICAISYAWTKISKHPGVRKIISDKI